jgi:hypothetical protein
MLEDFKKGTAKKFLVVTVAGPVCRDEGYSSTELPCRLHGTPHKIISAGNDCFKAGKRNTITADIARSLFRNHRETGGFAVEIAKIDGVIG